MQAADQVFGLLQGRGNGFFEKYVATFLDGFAGTFVVVQGGSNDVGYLHGVEQAVHVREGFHAAFHLDRSGIGWVGVVESDQFVMGRGGEQPQVYLSQMTGTEQTYFQHDSFRVKGLYIVCKVMNNAAISHRWRAKKHVGKDKNRMGFFLHFHHAGGALGTGFG